MRIVHISDTHYDKNDNQEWQELIDAMCSKFDEISKTKNIDLFLFSGDLIDKGKGGCECIEDGFIAFKNNVILPIKQRLKLESNQFIFTPGNHDVDVDADSKVAQAGLSATLNSEEIVKETIKKISSGKNDEGIKRIKAYKDFISEFYNYKDYNVENNSLHNTHINLIDEKKIGISCLNTAWRCWNSNEDYQKLLLGEQQVRMALKEIEDCDIKIALMHHRFDWLQPFDKRLVQNMILKEYQLLLCGHIHENDEGEKIKCDSSILELVGGRISAKNMCEDSKRYGTAFAVIDLNIKDILNVEIEYFSYNYDMKIIVNNTFAGINGKSKYNIDYSAKEINNRNNQEVVAYSDELITDLENVSDNREIKKLSSTEKEIPLAFQTEQIQIKYETKKSRWYRNTSFIKDYFQKFIKLSITCKKMHEEIEFILLYADKIMNIFDVTLNIDRIIEDIIINKELINANELSDSFKILEGWINLEVFSDIMGEQTINFPQSIDKLKEHINKNDSKIIELLEKVKNLYLDTESIDFEPEICKKIGVLISFLLPVYLISHNKNIWYKDGNNKISYDKEVNIDNFYLEDDYTRSRDSMYLNKITVIRGKRGVGKSAILNKLYKEVSGNKTLSIGLMYSFTLYRNITEAIKDIIKLCNSVLIRQINIEQLNIEEAKASTDIDILYKQLLIKSFESLSLEYSEVYLFIDGVTSSDNKLVDLLLKMEVEIKFIFTTSEVIDLNNNIAENEFSEILISNIEKEKISLVTKNNDEKLNTKIFEFSQGDISEIRNIMNELNNGQPDDIYNIMEKVMTKMQNTADVWVSDRYSFLEDILLMLSIFNKITMVSIYQIQKFMDFLGYKIRLPHLRMALIAVKDQLLVKDADKFKLQNGDFSEYILSEYFSGLDISRFLESLFNWLNQIDSEEYQLLALFLVHIKSINFNLKIKERVDSLIKEKVDGIIKKLEENCNDEMLFKIGFVIYNEFKIEKTLAIYFLDLANKKNNIKAQIFLAQHYLKNEDEISRRTAQNLLLKAINNGSDSARLIYVSAILDKKIRHININEALEMLVPLIDSKDEDTRESASVILATYTLSGIKSVFTINDSVDIIYSLIEKENVGAMYFLAVHYLDGEMVTKNEKEGLRLLLKAKDMGYEPACIEYARRLIYGDGIEQDIRSGLELLEVLEQEQCKEAQLEIARIVMENTVVKPDINRAVSILEYLVDIDYEDAIIYYSTQLLGKVEKVIDEKRGVELLSVLVEKNNVKAMCILGEWFIDKNEVEFVDRGIKLLRTAISLDDINSQVELARRYLDRGHKLYNEKIGLSLLCEAVNQDNFYAKITYAIYIISEVAMKDKIQEAIEILELGIKRGMGGAMRILGDTLIEGKSVNKDIVRGTELLWRAVDKGNIIAIHNLAQRYMYGIGLKSDIEKAKLILDKGIGFNDRLSKAILSRAIIFGKCMRMSIDTGIRLLNEAIDQGDIYAKRILGEILIKGIQVSKDKVRGERLLREASAKDSEATLMLAEMKIDGRYLEKDISEGNKLLNDAITQGNSEAMVQLASRMLDGDGMKKDTKRGEELFKQLIDNDCERAIIEYGDRLVRGKGIIKDKEEGGRLIENLVKKNNIVARRIRALEIIRGYIYGEILNQTQQEEVVSLLEKNIEDEDLDSLYILGSNLITGDSIQRDIGKGKQLLEYGCEMKNVSCQYFLGKRLLIGDILERDRNQGEELLINAMNNGDTDSKFVLAKYYTLGYVLEYNSLGWQYINELIEDGYIEAKRYLARCLIKGIARDKDDTYAKNLYMELIECEDDDTMYEYAEILYDGIYVLQDRIQADKLMNKCIKNNYINARYIKALRILRGEGMKRRPKKGAEKLKKLAYKGNKLIDLEYGIRKLKGLDINKDEEEGEKIIERCITDSKPFDNIQMAIRAYKLKYYSMASQLFAKSYEYGFKESLNGLAYMIRRGEFTLDVEQFPSVKDLLRSELEANSTLAKINFALYMISENPSEESWREADDIIGSIKYYDDCIEWWYDLVKDEDIEGKLVLIWLDRHKLIDSIVSLDKDKLCKDLSCSELYIPDWLYTQKNNEDENKEDGFIS